MKRLVASAALILALAPGASAWAGTWSGPATVASVQIEPDASASNGTATYLLFTPAVPANRPTCGSVTNSYSGMTGSADHVRALTSLVTAAFLAGRQVKVYWTGGCSGITPLISMVQVL